ncbi:MFS transporter [Leptolyngbya sp. AN03gr2]|uniref:MFS transporter n=1 Tax=unclassified Leptolyngbya TaxID=2650499 RepID=UPI003D31931C
MENKPHPIVNLLQSSPLQKVDRYLTQRKKVFLSLWIGQFLSAIGSRLTGFALGIWVYQQTSSVTQFALIYLCTYAPEILIAPFAGILADRWSRRWTMILGDSGAGLLTLAIAILILTSQAHRWLIYPILLMRSSFMVVQATAFSATVSQLAPARYWGQVSGLIQLAQAGSQILAPLLASLLLVTLQIQDVLWIDFISFLISLVILLMIRFPEHQSIASKITIFSDLQMSWQYVSQHRLLVKLLGLAIVMFFSLGALEVLFSPLVLSFASTTQLGIVISMCGCGWLLGSIAMSAWGGFQNKIHGVLGSVALQGFFLLLGGLKHSILLAALGGFGYMFTYPIALSCAQTIWQSQVDSELQGRIFGIKRMIENIPSIIAYLSMGAIAEQIFEPLLAEQGLLAGSVGVLIGTGAGRGIGFLFMILGLLNLIAVVIMTRLLKSSSLIEL